MFRRSKVCSRHFGVLLMCFTHCLRVVYFPDRAQPRQGCLDSSLPVFPPLRVESPRLQTFRSEDPIRGQINGAPSGVVNIPGACKLAFNLYFKISSLLSQDLNSIKDFKISRLKNIFQEFQVFQDFKMFLHLESKLKANLHACKRFASKTQFADR